MEKKPVCPPLSIEVPVETLLKDEELLALKEGGIAFLAVLPAFYDLQPDVIRERARVIEQMGLCIDTCHLPFGGGNSKHSVCAEDEAVRHETITMWRHYLDLFSLTGMRAVPMHTGGAMHPAAGLCAMESLTDTLRQVLPNARRSGVIIALENTFYPNPCPFSDAKNPSGVAQKYLNDDCAMLNAYVTQWAEVHIRVCHDVGHSLLFGNSIETDLKALRPLTALYHIHDNDGIEDRHWNVGEGVFPWRKLVNAWAEDGYASPVFNEVIRGKSIAREDAARTPKRNLAYYQDALRVLNACAE